MAEKILILSDSGNGKSYSIGTLDPKKTAVIQVKKKRFPFESVQDWKPWKKIDDTTGEGSRIYLNNIPHIKSFITKAIASGKKIIVIDDFVYLMSNRVMKDVGINGYDKWVALTAEIYDLFDFIDELDENIRVYITSHPDIDPNGNIKAKTAGNMIDKYINIEGCFTTVLGAEYKEKEYFFKTNKDRNSEPYKSPAGLFDSIYIPNSLGLVDKKLCERFGIED